jgi:hypothetical protein
MCRLMPSGDRVVGREVKIETVPQRVARAALRLDETGVNGSSFHAQTGQTRHGERGLGPVQIPPRAPVGPPAACQLLGSLLGRSPGGWQDDVPAGP